MSEDRRTEGQSEQSPWDMASGAFIAWRAGDASAVDELVAAMTPVLWHVVRAYGHDRQSAEALAVLDDEASRLWRAVASVDERCRKLLRVVAFMDRPDYQALSKDLDMPVGSIGPTRARCLAKVRRALTEGGER